MKACNTPAAQEEMTNEVQRGPDFYIGVGYTGVLYAGDNLDDMFEEWDK